MLGEVVRQVMYRSLARRIGIRFQKRLQDAVNRADVHHPRRIVLARRRLQQRQQSLRQKEDRLQIDVHQLVPAFFGVFLQRFGPGSSCIVDQEIELGFARLDVVGQRLHFVHLPQIVRHGNAGAEFRKLLRRARAGIRLARGDVDLHPVLHEPARDHQADAARSAGYQRRLAADVEKLRGHGKSYR